MLKIKQVFFYLIVFSLLIALSLPNTLAQTKQAKSKTATKPNQQQATTKPSTEAKLQEIDKKEPDRTSQTHSQFIISASFSQDGSKLLSSSVDGTVRLWDVKTGKQLKCFNINKYVISKIAISPNGKLALLTAFLGHTLYILDLSTGKELYQFSYDSDILTMSFLPDNYKVAVYVRGYFCLLDIKKKKEIYRLTNMSPSSNIINPSLNRYLAMSQMRSSDSFSLVDINTFKEIREFRGHTELIETIAISPDASIAVSTSFDNTLRVWDVETGKILKQQDIKNIRNSFISKILISKDNKFALFSGKGGNDSSLGDDPPPVKRRELPIYIFNIKEGKQEKCFVGHKGWLFDINISSDSQRAFYIGDDGVVHTANIETGQEVNSFKIAPPRDPYKLSDFQ